MTEEHGRTLKINFFPPADGHCHHCGDRAPEMFRLHCVDCHFFEVCCRACASPRALGVIAEVYLWREAREQTGRRLIEGAPDAAG